MSEGVRDMTHIRKSDGTLICGAKLASMDMVTRTLLFATCPDCIKG